VINQPLIECKGILPRHLFFCVVTGVYSQWIDALGFSVWPLYISFHQWTNNCTSLYKKNFNNCFEWQSLA